MSEHAQVEPSEERHDSNNVADMPTPVENSPGAAQEQETTGKDPAQEQAEAEAEAEAEAKEEERRRNNASAAALTLEIVGDLPHAEIKPPENILFVCKLNPVTRSDDLELIFSRFGKICSCEVIRDKKVRDVLIQTGDSLQYAFIEYEEREAAERVRISLIQAYTKMQNVLIDDRRIWVDFSQSVSKLHSVWVKQRTGRMPPAESSRTSRSAPSSRPDRGRSGYRAPHRPPVHTHPDMNTENVLVDLDALHEREPMSSSYESSRHHDRYDDRHRRRDREDYDRRRSHRDDDRRRRDRDYYERRYDRSRSDRSRSDYGHGQDRYKMHSDDRRRHAYADDHRSVSREKYYRENHRSRSRSP